MKLLLDITTSLTFLNFILKTYFETRHIYYNAYDVCDDNVIMYNPNSIACSIASRVTWLPCPFKINKCQLLRGTPPRIYLLKENKKSLNMKVIIHVFFCIAIQVPILHNLMWLSLTLSPLKMLKPNKTPLATLIT